MRKVLMSLLVSGVLMSGWAYDIASIKKGLRIWKPEKVSVNSKILTVVLPQKRITSNIYNAIIGIGCLSAHFTYNKNSFKGIKEIDILNIFGKQGFVFEGGKKEIEEMGKLKNKEAEIYVSSKTHLK